MAHSGASLTLSVPAKKTKTSAPFIVRVSTGIVVAFRAASPAAASAPAVGPLDPPVATSIKPALLPISIDTEFGFITSAMLWFPPDTRMR